MKSDETTTPAWLEFSSMLELPWLQAGVTTRHCEDIAHVLAPEAVAVATARQVHGNEVRVVSGQPESQGAGNGGDEDSDLEEWRFPAADALTTDRMGVAISVRVADCVPLVLVDPEHGAVAVAHCGWRGLAGGLVPATVAAMTGAYGTRPEECRAGIGPAVGPCCYTVGQEVREAFGARGHQAHFLDSKGTLRLDLWETTRRQLAAAGVPANSMESLAHCTSCRVDLFFSRRRDGEIRGQMMGFALIKL